MAAPLMELKYEVTLEDATEFALYHHRHSPTLVRRRRFLRVGMCGLLAIVAGAVGALARSPFLGAVGFAFALAFWFMFPRRYERGLRETVAKLYAEGKNLDVLGPTTLTLDEEFITETTPTREVRTRWGAVERVVDAPMHVFIYVTGSTALILPRRDLGEEASAKLLNELRARVPVHAQGAG
ncbi:MAG: YcxB family protein [Myxococcaceae bacterium]|nr:YcxB family protein [Myxococcaceae bacterium]